jgi:hypothetical protein
MRRRILLQWLAALGIPVRAQSQSTILRDLAAIVLPTGVDHAKAADEFQRYIAEYRPGADTDHGYGFTRIRPKPPSPAREYARQIAALPVPLTREAVEAALSEVRDIPRLPDGKNVIADFMSFYFRGAEANDLCYQAAIGRDTCRGLAGSSHEPKRLA